MSGLLAIATLAGCAAPRAAPVAVVQPAALTGTIVSARQVILPLGGAEGSVLGALGAPENAGATLAPATEFIVREADGAVISVVQPQPTGLHPGDQVHILRGVYTRLAPIAAILAAPAT
ncbi:MAG: hypothetical protein PHZ23_14900 [Acidiphilium sp.]|nr:hypothetical protein [Acidiphilium sp.]